MPTVIGHRGASGYRPEHTFGSYQLALDMGADIVEAGDLVPTKDGHLVCRHEPEIGGTTDVADHPEFAGRRTTKTLDGVQVTGWFTEDFTLAELKRLRAVERIPANRPHNTLYDGRWEIPTFEEVLRWQDEQTRKRGKQVWIYPELKHPTYFRAFGLGLEERVAKLLRKHGKDRRNSPVILQSFEPTSVQRLRELVDNPLVVLLSDAGSRPLGLRRVRRPAHHGRPRHAPGPEGDRLLRAGHRPHPEPDHPARLRGPAHRAHHPGPGRPPRGPDPAPLHDAQREPVPARRVPQGRRPRRLRRLFGAYRAYFATGIDGVFTDHPDTGLLAREDFVNP